MNKLLICFTGILGCGILMACMPFLDEPGDYHLFKYSSGASAQAPCTL